MTAITPTGKDCIKTLALVGKRLPDEINLKNAVIEIGKESASSIRLVLETGSVDTLEATLRKIASSIGGEMFAGESRRSDLETPYTKFVIREYALIPQAEARVNRPDIYVTAHCAYSRFQDCPF